MSKRFKKFLINKSAVVLGLLLAIIFLVLFLVSLFLLELIELNHSLFVFLSILKEISIIGFTVFASTLITALFIEKRSKNNEYISTIANEVISDPNVVNILEDEPKSLLRKRLADNSAIKQDMFESFVNNINNEDHYFESCDIDVTCKITNTYIEKTIVRNMSICSFKDGFVIKDFKLLGVAGKEPFNSGNSNLVNIKRIKIGNNILKGTEYQTIYEKVEDDSSDLKRNDYHFRCRCILPELKLSSETPVEICIEYTSRVGLDDMLYVSRATAPCKRYNFSFALENGTKKNYCIRGSAFGFMDNNMGNKHNNSTSSYNVDFNHWVYRHDGISIYIIKK